MNWFVRQWNRHGKFWGPVFLWMGITFLMSTSTFSAEHTSRIIEPIVKFLFPSVSSHGHMVVHAAIRKLAHLTEYFVLGLLLFRAFRGDSPDRHRWRWVLYSLAVIVLFAASDEYHQTFVTDRTPSVVDVGIDTVGGILGLLMIFAVRRIARAGSQKEQKIRAK